MNFSKVLYIKENIQLFIKNLLNSYKLVFIRYNCLLRKITHIIYLFFLIIKGLVYCLFISRNVFYNYINHINSWKKNKYRFKVLL